MTPEQITQWARVAGCHDNGDEFRFVQFRYLERFAAKVAAHAAAHEREECARVCDEKARGWKERPVPLLGFSAELEDCAAAIRARTGSSNG